MSKAPSMPMYWDAYLADTTHLTTEEHGAYMLLMAAMWRRDGSVPDCDADNARILGLTKSKWRKIKARLSQFLIIEGGTISQKKLQETWKKTQEIIQKNKENGAKGGRPISSKNNDLAKATGSDPVNPNKTIPEPEPEPKEIVKTISTQEVEKYLEYMKVHPKPIDGISGERLFSKLVNSGEDPNIIIAAAQNYANTVKGWSEEGKIQQSDNFLSEDRGKWRSYIPKKNSKKSELCRDHELLGGCYQWDRFRFDDIDIAKLCW